MFSLFPEIFLGLNPGKGGQVARSAGTFGKVVAHQSFVVLVQLPSGKLRLFQKICWATIGQVGNIEFSGFTKSKAGCNRWLGKKSHVRGVAMNPCDHNHGGGEGATGTGGFPRSPWGKLALGIKTRRAKKYSNKYVL